MSDKKKITVAELIELLNKCPQSAFVLLEGCDCVGSACGVYPYSDNDTEILIERL